MFRSVPPRDAHRSIRRIYPQSGQATVAHVHVLQESAALMAGACSSSVRDVEAVLAKLESLHADLRPLLNLALQVKQLRKQLQQLEPLIGAPPR